MHHRIASAALLEKVFKSLTGADNATYSIFEAMDDEFRLSFSPLCENPRDHRRRYCIG